MTALLRPLLHPKDPAPKLVPAELAVIGQVALLGLFVIMTFAADAMTREAAIGLAVTGGLLALGMLALRLRSSYGILLFAIYSCISVPSAFAGGMSIWNAPRMIDAVLSLVIVIAAIRWIFFRSEAEQ